ncbi:MAG: Ribonuclease R [Flavobacteriia bacterium]|nr:MAG: Ribonuclease R [Flavobacteriia bacterium]
MSKKKSTRGIRRVPKALVQSVLSELGKAPRQGVNYKQLSARLGITDENGRRKVQAALEQLLSEGRIKSGQPGRFELITFDQLLVGKVDMTQSGAAYVVVPEQDEDIYISPKRLRQALDGDEVKVRLYARKRGRKAEGEIVEVVQRKRTQFVGVLEKAGKFGFLIPDNKKMLVDLYIPEDKMNGARHGQKCIAQLTDWPKRASSPFGEITEVLGDPRNHEVEIHSILAEFDLPYAFPEEVEREAQRIPKDITKEDVAQRRDMRSVTTFTIDPADAKDFDDALSFQWLDDDLFEVGVHIADVTHYLKPGSVLDEEAVERATSVYLVDRVVPMLPEVLSNELCSLRPHEDKCTFSAVFKMDRQGVVHDRWFGRTLIHSDHRFAYEDAQAVIEGADHGLKEAVLTLHHAALELRKNRLRSGALMFDKEEVKFHLDDKGTPTGIYFKVSKDANHLIEEFMLLANREVAQRIGRVPKGQKAPPFVYRVHDEPNPTKVQNLQTVAKSFGYQVKSQSRKTLTQSMNSMLQEVKGKGWSNLIETLAIRSMAKAEYSTQNIGHFGLAFPFYSHFTSPIRRYPDVLVHRLLFHYLEGGKDLDAASYEALCEHCSEREKLATQAERASIKYMQTKYMDGHEGEEFDGVISGISDWGVYVELKDNKCEGMIRIRDFKDDYYVYEEAHHQIVGEATGSVYRLGDDIRIRVRKVDIDKKQIDFDLA